MPETLIHLLQRAQQAPAYGQGRGHRLAGGLRFLHLDFLLGAALTVAERVEEVEGEHVAAQRRLDRRQQVAFAGGGIGQRQRRPRSAADPDPAAAVLEDTPHVGHAFAWTQSHARAVDDRER